MKRNEWMALIVTSFMMFAVCLSASAKIKKTVERGMTKQEVVAIMGQPKLTSFDAYGDRWEYYKMNVITGESKRIVVGFDLNGRVVAYETRFGITTLIAKSGTAISDLLFLHTELVLMLRFITAAVSTTLPSADCTTR